jgi:hypothetical protein
MTQKAQSGGYDIGANACISAEDIYMMKEQSVTYVLEHSAAENHVTIGFLNLRSSMAECGQQVCKHRTCGNDTRIGNRMRVLVR